MNTVISVNESVAEITPVTDNVTIEILDSDVNVDVTNSVVSVDVVENPVELSIVNDKIDMQIVEQVVEIIIPAGDSNTVIPAPVEEEVYDIEIDTSVAGVTYVGEAVPGTSATQSLWRIKKITETASGSSVDWADGTAQFIHRWDQHLSLPYGP